MSLLRRALDAQVERRAVDWGPFANGSIPPPSMAIDPTDSSGGLPVTEQQALRLIDVYACVSLIADSVAMLPLRSYHTDGDIRAPVATSTLCDRPDPDIERWDFVCRVVTSLALRGNAYLVVLSRNAAMWPTAVRSVHPDDIRPRINPRTGELEFILRGYGKPLPREDVIHIPLITLPGSPLGLSPIECARRGIRLAVHTEQFGDNWFNDGATPSSVLESDAPVPDDEARNTVARWVASHGGKRRPALLSGGLKWKPITIMPNESQFIETRRLNTSHIARMWRVPPHMISDVEKSTSWGKGIEEQGIGYVVFTLGPYLHRIESAFTSMMPRPQYAKFDTKELLRGNTRERYASYAIGRQWGWLSVNDIRHTEDLPPIDGGDSYLQPLNMIDAQDALKALLGDNTGGGPSDNGGSSE